MAHFAVSFALILLISFSPVSPETSKKEFMINPSEMSHTTFSSDEVPTKSPKTDAATESSSTIHNCDDDEEPILYLTPMLNAGNISDARKAARVDSDSFVGIRSFSGFLTIDEAHNSNIFFWFFPANGTEHLYDDEEDNRNLENERIADETPLLLWLQGGPGMSSMYGLFVENGPFMIRSDVENTKITANPYSWHHNVSMLYIDQPIGTGFSHTGGPLKANLDAVTADCYAALQQFFRLFPWLRRNAFFVAGESFAGKYIPALGAHIIRRNQEAQNTTRTSSDERINLHGIVMGNALSDPMRMLDHGEYLFQMGLVDFAQRQRLREMADEVRRLPLGSDMAWTLMSQMREYYKSVSGYDGVYNVLRREGPDWETYVEFLQTPEIRKAIHVGCRIEFNAVSTQVFVALMNEIPLSAMHFTESLLEQNVWVLYYSGNLDIIVAYPLSVNAYREMKWSGSAEYLNANRTQFAVHGRLAGYIKSSRNFAEALVLDAGHMAASDQPETVRKLLYIFINQAAKGLYDGS